MSQILLIFVSECSRHKFSKITKKYMPILLAYEFLTVQFHVRMHAKFQQTIEELSIMQSFLFFSDIYRTNMFHLSSSGCALVLQKDLEYWGIDELMMEPCCALKYYPEIEICVNEKQV